MRSRVVTWRPYAAAAAVVSGLLGAGLMVRALDQPSPPPASSVSATGGSSSHEAVPAAPATGRQASSGKGHAGVEDLITGPVLPAARPVSISIRRLGIASRLESLGLDGRGAMEVPEDPARAGWYTLGPTPGALGPAVIAGHVTWNQVPAVFFDLARLRPGDRVRVARSDDRVAVFTVTDIRRYHKAEFPTGAVFGSIDHAGLRLITCAGDFDSSAHRYSDNVVVFARLARA